MKFKKTLSWFFVFIFSNAFYACSNAQSHKEIDIWSGEYVISFINDSTASKDTITIQKTKNVSAEKVTYKYKSDLKRWIIISKSNGYRDTITARRFLYDIKEGENEYDEFGWTDMYLKGEINCIDAGNFFICQTKPGTKVSFSKEESFTTTTGFVGVLLHYGLFELEKIK